MIVSTTLAGPGTEHIIGDALRSVAPFVDACIIIWTGPDADPDGPYGHVSYVADATLHEDLDTILHFVHWPWQDDFSAARNAALEYATALGYAWAITIDVDERLLLARDPAWFRATLAATPSDVNVLMVRHDSGTYEKERFFRLPTTERWTGPVHESFPSYKVGVRTLDRIAFTELDKTPEQWLAKFQRDAGALEAWTAKHPNDPRWWYYLGATYQELAQRTDQQAFYLGAAIGAYSNCCNLRGWNEESAWSCYRSAECWIAIGNFDAAVQACARGLARHAGIAELAWLAGRASLLAGDPQQAIYWSRLAIAGGMFCSRGFGAAVHRIGFRHPPALWEGPYETMRDAYAALGDHDAAAGAERNVGRARAARLAGCK